MKTRNLLAGAALLIASHAFAAPPAKAVLLDFSNEMLIDAATAKSVLAEGIPAKLWKVYAPSKWGFVSQVEGGLTAAGTCVVTARVMMVALSPTLKVPLYRPEKIATAFDGVAGSNADQCQATAKAKLSEATEAVVSSLVK